MFVSGKRSQWGGIAFHSLLVVSDQSTWYVGGSDRSEGYRISQRYTTLAQQSSPVLIIVTGLPQLQNMLCDLVTQEVWAVL